MHHFFIVMLCLAKLYWHLSLDISYAALFFSQVFCDATIGVTLHLCSLNYYSHGAMEVTDLGKINF